MDDNTLRAIVSSQLSRAVGSTIGAEGSSSLSTDREKALKYYFGEPFGNEIEGRSQFVSRDVSDVIEWMLPNLMEIFFGGDRVVEVQPQGQEDIEIAEQASEYLEHIWSRDNDGFRIGYDWFKDALLEKSGYIKITPGEPKTTTETWTGLNLIQLFQLDNDPELEVTDFTPRMDEETGEPVFDLEAKRTTHKPVEIEGLAPEDVFFSSRTVDYDDTPCVGYYWRKTASELIQEGYSRDLVDSLPSDDTQSYISERQVRFSDEDLEPEDPAEIDSSMRSISGAVMYLRVDYDGDGINELREINFAGYTGIHILENNEIDEQPIVGLTPIPIPHKAVGQSIADQTMDLQRLKSTIIRQFNDNIYQINNGRTLVNERIDMSDMMTNRVGGVVRVSGEGPAAEAAFPLMPQPLGDILLPALEYVDQIIESRTGQSRYNQGLDPNTLNKTATGVNLIMTASQKRLQLIARVFAETGVKRAFEKILRLVIAHQDKARMIRLRGEFVPIDPKDWNATMDVTVAVGLGHGSREQQASMIGQLLQVQQGIVQFQGGANGPLVYAENIYNTVEQFIQKAVGFKTAEPFITDPGPSDQQQQPQPQPDPKALEVQAKAQQQAQQAQMDHQFRMDKLAKEFEIDKLKAELEYQVKGWKAEQDVRIETGKAVDDFTIRSEKTDAEVEIVRRKADVDGEIAREKAETAKPTNGSPVTLQLGQDVPLEGFMESIAETQAGVKQSIDAMGEAIREFAKPIKVVREKGKIVGAERVEDV